VYDIDSIRGLCRDLSREKDPANIEEPMEPLRAVMKEDHGEVRVRIRFLTKKYAHFLAEPQAQASVDIATPNMNRQCYSLRTTTEISNAWACTRAFAARPLLGPCESGAAVQAPAARAFSSESSGKEVGAHSVFSAGMEPLLTALTSISRARPAIGGMTTVARNCPLRTHS
jgi:hypothetical protein